MRSLLVLTPLLVAAPLVGDTLHVPAHWPTIQLAVDAAQNGDIIEVAPGTWSSHGEAPVVHVSGTHLTIRGGGDGVVLDGQGDRQLIVIQGDAVVTLDHLTMRDGVAPTISQGQDIDGSGVIDVADLLAILADWGACDLTGDPTVDPCDP